MPSHFATLREAKKEYQKRTGFTYGTETLDPVRIYNRNKNRQKKAIKQN